MQIFLHSFGTLQIKKRKLNLRKLQIRKKIPKGQNSVLQLMLLMTTLEATGWNILHIN